MADAFIKDKIIAQIDNLPYELQLRVLDFAQGLVLKGIKGKELLKFEGIIPPDDLQLISKAIEENCEKVDTNAW